MCSGLPLRARYQMHTHPEKRAIWIEADLLYDNILPVNLGRVPTPAPALTQSLKIDLTRVQW